jgi:Tfp pilus assembly protein PilZ
MSENNWFVFQGNQQQGPFDTAKLSEMVTSKIIAQDAYIFKAGWKDWRPLEDCYGEIGVEGAGVLPSTPERRFSAPRATVHGRVIVHNNGQLIIGSGVNISSTGIFVETQEQLFTIGEKLKISLRIDGVSKAFNVFARVVRFNSDPRSPVGFGLTFESLDKHIGDEIERLVAAKLLASQSKVG